MNTFIEIIPSKGSFDGIIRLSGTVFTGLLHQVTQRDKLKKMPRQSGGAIYFF
jgi:hypothetical protein